MGFNDFNGKLVGHLTIKYLSHEETTPVHCL